jgi:hypothetical protein
LLTKINPAFFKDDLYEAMDAKSKHFITSGEKLIASFYKENTRFNKEIQELEPLFSNQARKRKKQFKWAARTWRLKIKQYLKKYPSHAQ